MRREARAETVDSAERGQSLAAFVSDPVFFLVSALKSRAVRMANLPNISCKLISSSRLSLQVPEFTNEYYIDSDAAQELAVICSPGYLTHHAHSRSFSSQQIAHVARLLEIVDHGVWSTVPRLYIVLRSAGLLKLRGLFLSVQHTDAHFPYSVFTLPTGVKLDERSAFLQAQACILTEATPYGKWDFGEHAHFANSDHVPLARKDVLGTGGSGQVESVVLRSSTSKVQSASDQLFVRKLIHRKRFGRLQQGLEEFKNELKILKRIQHRHLVEIIGSYTDPTFAALIMSPIADCDLSEFLKKIAPNNSRRRSTMRTFFGCLATALSYLHGKRIRHRDLKPSNILVHGPNVLITDFGSPRDCNETRSTTEGRPIGTTAKYNAPEVADHAERSFSADIWSLGCVFLEMFSVLKGFGVEQIAVFMRRDGSGESSYYAETAHYHANSRSVWRWLSMLRESSTHEPNNEPANWIQAMLSEDRYVRPKADVLALEIATCQSASGHSGEFCGICCRPEDEEFVDMEMDDASIVIPESPIFEPKLQDAKIIASTEEISMPSAAAAEFRMEYGAQRNLMRKTRT